MSAAAMVVAIGSTIADNENGTLFRNGSMTFSMVQPPVVGLTTCSTMARSSRTRSSSASTCLSLLLISPRCSGVAITVGRSKSLTTNHPMAGPILPANLRFLYALVRGVSGSKLRISSPGSGARINSTSTADLCFSEALTRAMDRSFSPRLTLPSLPNIPVAPRITETNTS